MKFIMKRSKIYWISRRKNNINHLHYYSPSKFFTVRNDSQGSVKIAGVTETAVQDMEEAFK